MSVKIVIELTDTAAGDAVTRRGLADIDRRIQSGELALGDVTLSTPFTDWFVARIVGVVFPPEASSTAITVSVEPLEGFKKVTL